MRGAAAPPAAHTKLIRCRTLLHVVHHPLLVTAHELVHLGFLIGVSTWNSSDAMRAFCTSSFDHRLRLLSRQGADLGFVEAAALRHLSQLLMTLHESAGPEADMLGRSFAMMSFTCALLRVGEVKVDGKETEHMAAKREAHADRALARLFLTVCETPTAAQPA